MEITWLGHSCIRLRAKEATLVADPCAKSTGYSIGRPTADLVTVSVDEPGHNFVGGVAGSPRVIEGPGEFEVAGASVVGVTTGRLPGSDGSRNVVYVVELE